MDKAKTLEATEYINADVEMKTGWHSKLFWVQDNSKSISKLKFVGIRLAWVYTYS